MKTFVVTEHHLDSSWMVRASCRGKTALYFPAGGGVPGAEAKALCRDCPVRRQCAAYAKALPEPPTGMWAGEAGHERGGA